MKFSSKPRGSQQPRQVPIDFDRSKYENRDAILKAVWAHVQPIIGRSTSWSDWRARNARIADSFVKGGYTPEQIVKAWEFACSKEGGPVRELSRVQRFLEDLALFTARKAAQA